jgi:hypothetical protein
LRPNIHRAPLVWAVPEIHGTNRGSAHGAGGSRSTGSRRACDFGRYQPVHGGGPFP